MRVHRFIINTFPIILIFTLIHCKIPQPVEHTGKTLTLEELSFKGHGNSIQYQWIELEGDLNVKVSIGQLKRFWFISPTLVEPDSNHFGNRIVDVWLPPNYDTSIKYPVIYFNDGQMLFDAGSTWNGQEWHIDETMVDFINQGKSPYVVVGIYNAGKSRHQEYLPEDIISLIESNQTSNEEVNNVIKAKQNGEIFSNNYLEFLTKELRPMIEKQFSVSKHFSQNFIAGSSMGGLISYYACMKQRNLWGGMIALSSHWPVVFSLEDNPFPKAFLDYTRSNISLGHNHQIWYLSTGTETLDSLYANAHNDMVKMVLGTGKIQKNNFKHEVFQGMNHSEDAWSQQFPKALKFIESRRIKNVP